jgi:gamma-glutamyltranspeptidase/glutathione hydrolase
MEPDQLESWQSESYAAEWVAPASVPFRGYEVCTTPPNSQGLLQLLALSILEPLDLTGQDSAALAHLQIEAIGFALERARQAIADPNFHSVAVDWLLSPELAAEGRARLDRAEAGRPLAAAAGDTVYLCAADREGTVVSMIQSLREGFGSGLMVPGLGVVLNNRARDFALADGDPNQVAPGKRPRHTLSPALVLRDGKAVAAYGTRGGDAQPYTMVQLGCNLLALGMAPQSALDAPRWTVEPAAGEPSSGAIALEGRFPADTSVGLEALGHRVVGIGEFDPSCGVASMVQSDGAWLGGADPRGDGLALSF